MSKVYSLSLRPLSEQWKSMRNGCVGPQTRLSMLQTLNPNGACIRSPLNCFAECNCRNKPNFPMGLDCGTGELKTFSCTKTQYGM